MNIQLRQIIEQNDEVGHFLSGGECIFAHKT